MIQPWKKQVIEWDQEFRLSLKDNYGDKDEPKKNKLSLSKVTLFQMMQEKDWTRMKSPEFEGTSIVTCHFFIIKMCNILAVAI